MRNHSSVAKRCCAEQSDVKTLANAEPKIRCSIQRLALLVGSLFALLVFVFCLIGIDRALFQQPPLVAIEDAQSGDFDGERLQELYGVWGSNLHARTFEWQEHSSQVLFWISVLITVIGISLAIWQFAEASRTEKAAEHVDQLEVKTQFVALAFKSRSLATFMLCISLAYLLIYVHCVYPIKFTSQITIPVEEANQPVVRLQQVEPTIHDKPFEFPEELAAFETSE